MNISDRPEANKKGTARLRVDYLELSAIALGEWYPFQQVDSVRCQIRKLTVFTRVDSSTGFHEIPILNKNIPKAAFMCPQVHYKFVEWPLV